jgi:oligopeptide transport system substrate-binding protein
MAPEQLIVFEANERYWAGRPRVDRLEYVFVADSGVALEVYRTGDLDMIHLNAGLLEAIKGDAALRQEVVLVPAAATSLLSFNLNLEPFTDKNVREAFAYAFDRETYCALLRDGSCMPALSWIPPGVPGHIATDAYAFDPARARQALATSSYGGPEQLPEITFVYWVEDPLAADQVEWIAGQYRDVLGVEIALQPLDGKALVAAASGPATYPHMTFEGWIQDYPDPQNWLSVYWVCGGGFAAAFGYCNQEFDALVAQADRELDPAERLALYEAAGHLLVADAPGVFLSHAIFPYLVKPTVSGYTPTPIDAAWPGQTTSLLTLDIAE